MSNEQLTVTVILLTLCIFALGLVFQLKGKDLSRDINGIKSFIASGNYARHYFIKPEENLEKEQGIDSLGFFLLLEDLEAENPIHKKNLLKLRDNAKLSKNARDKNAIKAYIRMLENQNVVKTADHYFNKK